MNKNDFRNPLIQSGAVLLFIFLLISIVANSGPNGIVGNISALFSGLISGILFLIALSLGVIISVAILIGIFIAAVSIHSVDKARDLFNWLVTSLGSLYGKFTCIRFRAKVDTANHPPDSASLTHSAAGTDESAALQKLQKRLVALEKSMSDILTAQSSTGEQLNALQESVTSLVNDSSTDKYNSLDDTQQALAEKIDKLSSSLDSSSAQLSALESKLADDRTSIQAEIAQLHKKTSVPAVVTGILSYIDLPVEREKITDKAEEAVSRGMTYSQIDAFFKSTLSPDIHKILAEHPRLTKDFLRSIKKKFA